MELVLYEFVEVLIRIAFWRANPYHGIHKLATKLVPLPDCLHQMLHEVVLPNAKRDDSALFKERLAGDKAMQAALLVVRGEAQGVVRRAHAVDVPPRRGPQAAVPAVAGPAQEGVGHRRARSTATRRATTASGQLGDLPGLGDHGRRALPNKFKISLSLPQAKFAFINAVARPADRRPGQGHRRDDDARVRRVQGVHRALALDKYKPIRQMSPR